MDIDLSTYDDSRSLSMIEACGLMRGRYGRLHLHVARRFANPRKGCRPAGGDGPTIFLPAVRVGNELRTMPEWVEAFERERIRLATAARQRRLRELVTPAMLSRPKRFREAAIKRARKVLDEAGI